MNFSRYIIFVAAVLVGACANGSFDNAEPSEAGVSVAQRDQSGGGLGNIFGFLKSNSVAPSGDELLPVRCDARGNLGQRVERRAGITLYDTAPDTTVPHSFYLTGFSDGCAREIQAAVVMFGDIGAYDTRLLYNGRERSAFDKKVESLKSNLCRVRPSEPCGSRSHVFDRSVALISAYDHFGAPKNRQIIIYGRKLQAISLVDQE